MGDFNFPDIHWPTLSAGSSSSILFCDLIFRLNLTQHVVSATHVMGNLLDLVVSNCPDQICGNTVDVSEPHSDHFQVNFTIHTSVSFPAKPKSVLSFDFKNADMDGLLNFLLDHDFSQFLDSTDIEFLWNYLRTTILDAMIRFVPHKRPCKKKWFTSEIRHNINKLRSLRRKLRAYPIVIKLESHIMPNLQHLIQSANGSWESKLVSDFANSKNQKIYIVTSEACLLMDLFLQL